MNRIRIGLLLIVAFSLGLASVLVGIGILVVRAKRWLARFEARKRATRFLPLLSATVITISGLGISIQSLAGTGIWTGGIAWTNGALVVLGLGLVLGLKHATDADHVVAVTTFVSEQRSLWRSCWIGAFWGVGHTLSLAVAGLVVIGLRVNISEAVSARLELAVAAMLVVLGVRVLFQRNVPPSYRHVHDNLAEHSHSVWGHFGVRPLLVGMVHGAAGSAALMLLVLSTIRSPLEAFLYILIFGFGSIVGMLAISLLLALPLHWARGRVATSSKSIQLMAGLFSCVFGLYLGAHLWMSLP